MYGFLLTVHVLAAVIWVGGATTMHIFGRLATGRTRSASSASPQSRSGWGTWCMPPLSVILLVAGILLVDEVGYSYRDLWITIGFLSFLTSFLLGVGYYARAGRRYAAIAANEGAGSPRSRSTGARRP